VEFYPFELIDGHIIAQIDGQHVLIDTGSLYSFGDSPLHINGAFHQLPTSMLGLSAGTISRFIRHPIDVLLGGDHLADMVLTVNWDTAQVILGETSEGAPATRLPLAMVMGIPAVEVLAQGNAHCAFFDTGAKISYLPGEVLDAGIPFGEVEDFYPGIGTFTTRTATVDIVFANHPLHITAGELPPLLAMMLMMTGVRAIVGTDIMQQWNVTVNYANQYISCHSRISTVR